VLTVVLAIKRDPQCTLKNIAGGAHREENAFKRAGRLCRFQHWDQRSKICWGKNQGGGGTESSAGTSLEGVKN